MPCRVDSTFYELHFSSEMTDCDHSAYSFTKPRADYNSQIPRLTVELHDSPLLVEPLNPHSRHIRCNCLVLATDVLWWKELPARPLEADRHSVLCHLAGLLG